MPGIVPVPRPLGLSMAPRYHQVWVRGKSPPGRSRAREPQRPAAHPLPGGHGACRCEAGPVRILLAPTGAPAVQQRPKQALVRRGPQRPLQEGQLCTP